MIGLSDLCILLSSTRALQISNISNLGKASRVRECRETGKTENQFFHANICQLFQDLFTLTCITGILVVYQKKYWLHNRLIAQLLFQFSLNPMLQCTVSENVVAVLCCKSHPNSAMQQTTTIIMWRSCTWQHPYFALKQSLAPNQHLIPVVAKQLFWKIWREHSPLKLELSSL